MRANQTESKTDSSEDYFDCITVTRLTRIKEDFLLECEHEQLIATRTMPDGSRGLCSKDVLKLKMIRHLHYDMGLDLEAVDFVLRYRDQIKALKQRFAEREQLLRQKEQEHLAELRALRRRLAEMGAG